MGYDANRYSTQLDTGPAFDDPGEDVFPLIADLQARTSCSDYNDAEKTPRPPRALFSKAICKRSREECPRLLPPSLRVISSQEPMPPTLDTRWPGNRNVHRFLIHSGAGLPNDQSNPMAEIANADPNLAAPLETARPLAEISEQDDPWQSRDKFENKVPFDTITNALGETVLCFQEAEPFPPTTTKGAIYFPERLALPNPKLSAAQGYDVHAPIRHKREQYKERPIREKTNDEMYREIREEMHYRTNQDIMRNRNGDLPFQQLSEGKPIPYDVTYQASVQHMQQTLPPTTRDERETPYVTHGDAQDFAGLPQVQDLDRCLQEGSHYTQRRDNIADIELTAADRQLPSAYGARYFSERSMETRTPLPITQRTTTSLAGPRYGPVDASAYQQHSLQGTTDRDNTPLTPEYLGTDQHAVGAQWQYGTVQSMQSAGEQQRTDRGLWDHYYTTSGQSAQAPALQSSGEQQRTDRGLWDHYYTTSGQSGQAPALQSSGEQQRTDRGLAPYYTLSHSWNPAVEAAPTQGLTDTLSAQRGYEGYRTDAPYSMAEQAPLMSTAQGPVTARGADERYYTVTGQIPYEQAPVWSTGQRPTDRGSDPYYSVSVGQRYDAPAVYAQGPQRSTDREWQYSADGSNVQYGEAGTVQATGQRSSAQTGLWEQNPTAQGVSLTPVGPLQTTQQRHTGQSGSAPTDPTFYATPSLTEWSMPGAYATAFHPQRRTGLEEQPYYGGDIALPYEMAAARPAGLLDTDRGQKAAEQWPVHAAAATPAAPLQSTRDGRPTDRNLEATPYYGSAGSGNAAPVYSTEVRHSGNGGLEQQQWLPAPGGAVTLAPLHPVGSVTTDRGYDENPYRPAGDQASTQQQFFVQSQLRPTLFAETENQAFAAGAHFQGLSAPASQGLWDGRVPHGGAAESVHFFSGEGAPAMPTRPQGQAGLLRDTQKDFGPAPQYGNRQWMDADLQAAQTRTPLRPTNTGALEDTFAAYQSTLGVGAASGDFGPQAQSHSAERGPPARAQYADTESTHWYGGEPTAATERGPLLAYNVPQQTERSSTDPERLAYFGGRQPPDNSIRPRDTITVGTRTDNRGFRDVWDYRDQQKVRDGQEISCTDAYIGTWGQQTMRAENDMHVLRDPYAGFHVSDRLDMRRSDYYTGGSASTAGTAQVDPRTVRSIPPSPVMTFGAVRAKEGLYGLAD